jgi:hypothetical protein
MTFSKRNYTEFTYYAETGDSAAGPGLRIRSPAVTHENKI